MTGGVFIGGGRKTFEGVVVKEEGGEPEDIVEEGGLVEVMLLLLLMLFGWPVLGGKELTRGGMGCPAWKKGLPTLICLEMGYWGEGK